MLLPGNGQKLCAVSRHQRLIGGDHILARHEAGLHEGIGRIQSAHGFHHNLHFLVLLNHLEIVDDLICHRTVRELP